MSNKISCSYNTHNFFKCEHGEPVHLQDTTQHKSFRKRDKAELIKVNLNCF